MKLTHKTVARMAGYVVHEYEPKRAYSDNPKYYWEDSLGSDHSLCAENCFDNQEDAYKACCEYCKLIDESST